LAAARASRAGSRSVPGKEHGEQDQHDGGDGQDAAE
jgi:hypothetical protein